MARILVVDDEPYLRSLIEESINTLFPGQHTVIQASGDAEALALFRQNPFQLVISDGEMPTLKGPELLRQIKCEHPETAVIGITANPNNYPAFQNAGVDIIVSKPFKLSDFAIAVKTALAGQKS